MQQDVCTEINTCICDNTLKMKNQHKSETSRLTRDMQSQRLTDSIKINISTE